MSDGSQSPDTNSSERRLPTKAQIRAAAYGGRQLPPIVDLSPQTAQEPLPLPVQTDSTSADTWLIAATKADGWDIWLCDQVLRGHEIQSEVVTSGVPSVRVRRKDYSAAIRKLQQEKSRLWRKPTSSANLIVSLVFIGTLALLSCGGVIGSGIARQTSGVASAELVFFAILIPVILLGAFYLASLVRWR
jgi:hypothetical protein